MVSVVLWLPLAGGVSDNFSFHYVREGNRINYYDIAGIYE